MLCVMSDSRVSSSRLGRLTRLAGLGRRAVPVAIKRFRETVEAPPELRGEIAARALKKHGDLADKAFKTLGDMKGVALKLGQMVSYMDGAVPAELVGVYQDVLARLQQQAPALKWSAVRPVLEAELGALDRHFTDIEEEPFAAASIGQVHRATLPDGRRVAVKIQYPGVDRAMRSDLKNAEMFQALMSPFMTMLGAGRATRGYMRDVMAEIRERLLEELDYEREAATQMRFRQLLADDRELVIPAVHPGLSTRRVLTTDLIVGRSLQEVCETEDQAARDRYGSLLTHAVLTSLYRFGLFNADPHPGNYLFPDDGTVCLLDYGCVKELPDWMRSDMRSYLRHAIIATRTNDARDWDRFDAALAHALHLDRSDPKMFRLYREFSLYIMRPALTDAPFDFTSAFTRESIDRVLDGVRETVFGKTIPRMPNIPPVPPDYTFINRLQWGFYSILSMLRARVNWHALLPHEVRG
ncbi:MAG: AarF/ABC1/UbiB kinase family protein [Deltaproteobacteria bacterium]|nr:MAG: AarF/ABC1/UbiB kinase family protein [Deltaproteobacteria bacterium]